MFVCYFVALFVRNNWGKQLQLSSWNACPGGAIGSVSVRAAWLRWPTSLASRPRLAGSFVSDYSGVCFEIKFLGRHRVFDSVLFKLWPLANTGFRGAQSLVVAWTTDYRPRWRTTAESGRLLMALFARVPKLGSGAYGARHARLMLSVMQWILAVRETVVIKPSRLNIVAQGLSNSLPRSLP